MNNGLVELVLWNWSCGTGLVELVLWNWSCGTGVPPVLTGQDTRTTRAVLGSSEKR
ncbi:hypothetical protein [Scytonema sp. NUACC26]|uniref:hypothetical protein n=1 Tax=Scytonema sp. NUACC26 TaxID=3140176 RepID=UPI0034DCBB19